MTVRRRNITVTLAPRADGVYEDARELTIVIDKQGGHELALVLARIEQTTLHVHESVKELRKALDVELIGIPQ